MQTRILLSLALIILPPNIGSSSSRALSQTPSPEREEKLLLTAVEFLKENPNGSTASRRRAPSGARVKVLLSSPVSSLAEYRNHHLWVPNSLLENSRKERGLTQATSQSPVEKPTRAPSTLNPELLLEEHTPIEITARISSLKFYSPNQNPSKPTKSPKPSSNKDLIDSISPADFSLVWGPYDRPGFRSRQEERMGVAQYPDSWNRSLGDVRHSWRNFHLISNSPEITEKIRSCQPNDRILLKGSLSSVYKKNGRSLWKGSRAMGFCPVVVVHTLEILPAQTPRQES
jgi:hypothetical protein